jgi:acylphosphatase
MSVAKKVIFEGRVQGVGFRFTTFNIANSYEVSGYVRNCSDGTVEMHAQGPDDQIQNLIKDIKAYFKSNITNIQEKKTGWDGNFQDFKITF